MPGHEHPVLVRNLLFAAHCVSLAEILAAVFASAGTACSRPWRRRRCWRFAKRPC